MQIKLNFFRPSPIQFSFYYYYRLIHTECISSLVLLQTLYKPKFILIMLRRRERQHRTMTIQAPYRGGSHLHVSGKSPQANRTAVSTVPVSTLSGPTKSSEAQRWGFHRTTGPEAKKYHLGDICISKNICYLVVRFSFSFKSLSMFYSEISLNVNRVNL